MIPESSSKTPEQKAPIPPVRDLTPGEELKKHHVIRPTRDDGSSSSTPQVSIAKEADIRLYQNGKEIFTLPRGDVSKLFFVRDWPFEYESHVADPRDFADKTEYGLFRDYLIPMELLSTDVWLITGNIPQDLPRDWFIIHTSGSIGSWQRFR